MEVTIVVGVAVEEDEDWDGGRGGGGAADDDVSGRLGVLMMALGRMISSPLKSFPCMSLV